MNAQLMQQIDCRIAQRYDLQLLHPEVDIDSTYFT